MSDVNACYTYIQLYAPSNYHKSFHLRGIDCTDTLNGFMTEKVISLFCFKPRAHTLQACSLRKKKHYQTGIDRPIKSE